MAIRSERKRADRRAQAYPSLIRPHAGSPLGTRKAARARHRLNRLMEAYTVAHCMRLGPGI